MHYGGALRFNAADPGQALLPPELKLTGQQITYGPEQMDLRQLHLSGPGLDLQVPGGAVGTESGKLSLPGIKLSGGVQAGRVLRAAGRPVTVRDVAVSLNLT